MSWKADDEEAGVHYTWDKMGMERRIMLHMP